jgi:Fuc2NAc and GlcNAc transferase
MTAVLFFIVVAVVAMVGTGMVRAYALRHDVLDVPQARSSHSTPTPRGGGLAIVVAFLGALVVLLLHGNVDRGTAIGIGGAALLVAVVGFIDDHRSLPARVRFIAHVVAAAWGLWWLGGLPPLIVAGRTVGGGIIATVVAGVALVWLLNLYNFMDGIDGLAGAEAVTICAGAMLAQYMAGVGAASALTLALAAASLGFLLWNLPPARIFMGDVASGFLGITLGLIAIRDASLSAPLLASWTILLGVFVVDATATLLRRMRRGERVWEAHRSHAYQVVSRAWNSHGRVTLTVALINLGWLTPIAIAVATQRLDGVLGIAIAYAPLVLLSARAEGLRRTRELRSSAAGGT